MTVQEEARRMVAGFEGYVASAAPCPAGVLTVGYGHTGPDVYPGLTITRQHADALLESDLAKFSDGVRNLCPEATEHQHWAMTSLAFNIGLGLPSPGTPKGAGFYASTVRRLHLKGDYEGAARAFSMWNKATVDGRLQELPGLTRRRALEAAFYLTPDDLAPTVMPQAIAPPPAVATSKTVVAGSVSILAGAASVADQLNQVTPLLDQVAKTGASVQAVARLGAVGLSVIALVAVVFVVVRYIAKKRDGQAT